MTTMAQRTTRCGLCGHTQQDWMYTSTYACGAPDLDLRPPPFERDLIDAQIQRCGGCGYCAPRLDKVRPAARHWVGGPGYLRLLGDGAFPSLACSFRAHASIMLRSGDWRGALWSTLRAAWVCDDQGLPYAEAARACRRTALGCLCEGHARGRLMTGSLKSDWLLELDLMRRTQQFDAVIVAARSSLPLLAGTEQAVAVQQLALARLGDADCHRVAPAGPDTYN